MEQKGLRSWFDRELTNSDIMKVYSILYKPSHTFIVKRNLVPL